MYPALLLKNFRNCRNPKARTGSNPKPPWDLTLCEKITFIFWERGYGALTSEDKNSVLSHREGVADPQAEPFSQKCGGAEKTLSRASLCCSATHFRGFSQNHTGQGLGRKKESRKRNQGYISRTTGFALPRTPSYRGDQPLGFLNVTKIFFPNRTPGEPEERREAPERFGSPQVFAQFFQALVRPSSHSVPVAKEQNTFLLGQQSSIWLPSTFARMCEHPLPHSQC